MMMAGDVFADVLAAFGAPAVLAARTNILCLISAVVLLPLCLLKVYPLCVVIVAVAAVVAVVVVVVAVVGLFVVTTVASVVNSLLLLCVLLLLLFLSGSLLLLVATVAGADSIAAVVIVDVVVVVCSLCSCSVRADVSELRWLLVFPSLLRFILLSRCCRTS